MAYFNPKCIYIYRLIALMYLLVFMLKNPTILCEATKQKFPSSLMLRFAAFKENENSKPYFRPNFSITEVFNKH
jgi:hypothetical protein